MACVAMEEYRADVNGTEVTFSRVDGAAATVPMDAVNSSETLRNIVASSVGGEYESVVLQLWFPLQLLDRWVQCVRASASGRQQLDGSRFCTLDTPTLVCYAQARFGSRLCMSPSAGNRHLETRAMATLDGAVARGSRTDREIPNIQDYFLGHTQRN